MLCKFSADLKLPKAAQGNSLSYQNNGRDKVEEKCGSSSGPSTFFARITTMTDLQVHLGICKTLVIGENL